MWLVSFDSSNLFFNPEYPAWEGILLGELVYSSDKMYGCKVIRLEGLLKIISPIVHCLSLAVSERENASKFRSEAVYLLANPSRGPCTSCVLISYFSFSCVSQEGPGEEPQQLPGVFLFLCFYIYSKCFHTFKIHFSSLKFESKQPIWFNEPTTFIKLHMWYWGFPFLHTFTSVYYFWTSWWWLFCPVWDSTL